MAEECFKLNFHKTVRNRDEQMDLKRERKPWKRQMPEMNYSKLMLQYSQFHNGSVNVTVT